MMNVDYAGYNEEYAPLELCESSIRAVKLSLQATGAKVVFQSSTHVEYNLTTNSRILAYNAAAKKAMAETPTGAYNDLYQATTDICGQPPYNCLPLRARPAAPSATTVVPTTTRVDGRHWPTQAPTLCIFLVY